MEQDGNLRKKSVLIRWQRGQTALETPVISRDEKEMSCRQRYILACIARDTFEESCAFATQPSRNTSENRRLRSCYSFIDLS